MQEHKNIAKLSLETMIMFGILPSGALAIYQNPPGQSASLQGKQEGSIGDPGLTCFGFTILFYGALWGISVLDKSKQEAKQGLSSNPALNLTPRRW